MPVGADGVSVNGVSVDGVSVGGDGVIVEIGTGVFSGVSEGVSVMPNSDAAWLAPPLKLSSPSINVIIVMV